MAPVSSISSFVNQNNTLLSSARRNREALQRKVALEKQSQQTHSSLWTFPTEEKFIEGICGCNAVVVYHYSFRVATFNQRLYETLFEQFLEIHDHNIKEVFMTLYEQTVSELQLSRLVHSQVPLLSQLVCRYQFYFINTELT